jgi:RNA polymerase sigma factor (sigma-70 family)
MFDQIWNKKTAKQDRSDVFEMTVLPYVSSGYNLARWLTRNEQDAEDALQEASLRAWRAFDTFQPGRDARAWFLAIVRNTCRSLHRQKQDQEMAIQLEDDSQAVDTCLNAKTMLIKKENLQTVHQALKELPLDYCEIIILRELEELSYKDIANICRYSIGNCRVAASPAT